MLLVEGLLTTIATPALASEPSVIEREISKRESQTDRLPADHIHWRHDYSPA
jgi:hypothetical protein